MIEKAIADPGTGEIQLAQLPPSTGARESWRDWSGR